MLAYQTETVSNQSRWSKTWMNPTRITTSQFTISGDHTDIFSNGTEVQLLISGALSVARVNSSSYSAGTTTVNLTSGVISNAAFSIRPAAITSTGSWGQITGSLNDQTDLVAALASKANVSHTHSAADIVSGIINSARLGSGTASSSTFLRGDGVWAAASTGSANWGSINGTLSNQTDLQTALNGKANTSHTHAAGDVTSGVFAAARLGSGTANSTTFLRGDSQWVTLTSSTSWGSITGTLSNQTDLQTALDGKSNTNHTHSAGAIVSGIMDPARLGASSANVNTFLRGDSNWAQVAYSQLSGIPGSFNPSAHTHAASDIVSGILSPARLGANYVSVGDNPNTFLAADGNYRFADWGYITNKPSTFTPSAHTHVIADVTNLQTSLNAKANLSGATFTGTVVAPLFQSSSDEKLKDTIFTLKDCDFIIKALRPVTFRFILSNSFHWGFVAQEVQQVIPQAVSEVDGFLRLDVTPVIAALVGSSQNTMSRVFSLEQRMAANDDRVADLERRVIELESEVQQLRDAA